MAEILSHQFLHMFANRSTSAQPNMAWTAICRWTHMAWRTTHPTFLALSSTNIRRRLAKSRSWTHAGSPICTSEKSGERDTQTDRHYTHTDRHIKKTEQFPFVLCAQSVPYYHQLQNGVHDKMLITIVGTVNPNPQK